MWLNQFPPEKARLDRVLKEAAEEAMEALNKRR
jgi:hypothetical protein